MKKREKKEKWVKKRHLFIRNLLSLLLTPYIKHKYGIKIEKFKEQKNSPYLILMNHQTPFDQFFVGIAFKGAVYYLATEDIFSNGIVSLLIRYLVAPIPIKKQTTDVKAILNCIKVAKEGGTIAIAPEGNRTYSGRTEYINPSIIPLARKLNMPIALFRIEGGYGVQPRWSDVVRKGNMRGYVSRVLEPEEYKKLSDDELFDIIKNELYVDEAVCDGEYRHTHLAEHLERAIYVCPYCGLSSFESRQNVIECKKCGRQIEYSSTKELRGIGFDFPYRFVAEWYNYQKDFVNELDLSELCNEPIYRDAVRMSEVIVYKKKRAMHKKAEMLLYGDRIEIHAGDTDYKFTFDESSAVTVLGRNKLNIYFNGYIYQIKGKKKFNALKYVNFFYRYRNILKGEENGKFLGL